MKTVENVINLKGIKGKCRWQVGEGLFMLKANLEILITNFVPIVDEVKERDEEKEIRMTLCFASGRTDEIQVDIKKIRSLDWFETSPQSVVYEYGRETRDFLKQLVHIQVAECVASINKSTYYKELGWNRDVFGNPVYVFGNEVIGGDKNATISSALREFELKYEKNKREQMLTNFTELLKTISLEGVIAIGYFFAGLIKQLYKEANVPANFVLYLFGKQQYRKTTLAKLTNNLYCRDSDMEFAVRTVAKTTATVAEKEISIFKDTTLILDDVSYTTDAEYRRTQEAIVEKITRFIGNNVRKNTNLGTGIKGYFPNANVIFTGEYVPKLPESTLSRMLIVEMWNPCNTDFLSKLEDEPLMLSTVAYDFICWVQERYDDVVNLIEDKFTYYRKHQVGINHQNRLHEHGFVIQSTFYLLYNYLQARIWLDEETSRFFISTSGLVRSVLNEQTQIMKDCSFDLQERDYCRTFVSLYASNSLYIANDKDEYDEENDDGFYGKKDCICISSVKLCAIMKAYYKDSSISVHVITKQFRHNLFLDMDKTGKSSKKVGSNRYLHIRKHMIEDYMDYLL